jgi:hypothetical protein
LDEVHWMYGTMYVHNNVTSLYFPIFLSVLCSESHPGYTLYCIPRSKMLLDWIYCRMFCKQCYILGGGYLSICPGRALCPFFTQMFDPSPSTSRGEGFSNIISQPRFSVSHRILGKDQSPQGWHEWKSYYKEDNQDFLSATEF